MILKEWLQLPEVKTSRYVEVFDEKHNLTDTHVIARKLTKTEIEEYQSCEIEESYIKYMIDDIDANGYCKNWHIARCIIRKDNLENDNKQESNTL